MADHECERCGRCCTDPNMKIPLTFGDVYRIRSEYMMSRRMYDVFTELSGGWDVMQSRKRPGVFFPIPKAKAPCALYTGDGCRFYDTRLVICGAFPEERLLDAPEGYQDHPLEDEFRESIGCLRGVVLSPERKARAEAIRDLAIGEGSASSQMLIPPKGASHPKMYGVQVPIIASSEGEARSRIREMEPGLNFMVKFMLTKKENIRRLKQNLNNGGFLKRYRELYPVDW
jgi:Fe-S-cluster containining protein